MLRFPNLPSAGATALALWMLGAASAHAQPEPSDRPEAGLVLREISVTSGYASLQLPPVTLGGGLPNDILQNDLVTSVQTNLGWSKVARNGSVLSFDVTGMYTARVKYSSMNAAGGTAALGITQMLGRKWAATFGVSTALFNSDQASFEPTAAQRKVNSATSVEDLAGRVNVPRSQNPDPSQAALFVPISDSAIVNDAYGNRLLTSVAKAGLTYTQSATLSVFVNGNYVSAQRVGSSGEPGVAQPFRDSQFYTANAGVSYSPSRATEVTAAVSRTQSTGLYVNEATSATFTFGWTGREWFTELMGGWSVRPAAPPASGVIPTDFSRSRSGITYTGNVGYKFRSQTLLAGIHRGLNDSQAYGSVEGDVHSFLASWYWSPLRSKWSAQANVTGHRTPGNFLYIYTWKANASIGREVRSNLQVLLEAIFDRHGSKAFEGFHMQREGFQVNLVWLPRKRLI